MRRTILLFALLAGLALAAPVFADQIFVQQSGTKPAGGDPNKITDPSNFVVGTAAGSATGEDPLLVIIGVYDSLSVPALKFGSTVESLAPIGTYHITADPETNSSGDEYGDLGLTPQTNSETFDQWANYDTGTLGLTKPSNFTLYAFDLAGEELNGTINLSASGVPNGSFIIGYDCKDDTGDCSLQGNHGNIMDTPFTNAGAIDARSTKPTPEPASLLLFGSGLLGLSFKLRRRFCR